MTRTAATVDVRTLCMRGFVVRPRGKAGGGCAGGWGVGAGAIELVVGVCAGWVGPA